MKINKKIGLILSILVAVWIIFYNISFLDIYPCRWKLINACLKDETCTLDIKVGKIYNCSDWDRCSQPITSIWCKDMTQKDQQEEQHKKELCEKTWGKWTINKDRVYNPRYCECDSEYTVNDVTKEQYKVKYTLMYSRWESKQFSNILWCFMQKEWCDNSWGKWEDFDYYQRLDISDKKTCLSWEGKRIWNEQRRDCILTSFPDWNWWYPSGGCRMNGKLYYYGGILSGEKPILTN